MVLPFDCGVSARRLVGALNLHEIVADRRKSAFLLGAGSGEASGTTRRQYRPRIFHNMF